MSYQLVIVINMKTNKKVPYQFNINYPKITLSMSISILTFLLINIALSLHCAPLVPTTYVLQTLPIISWFRATGVWCGQTILKSACFLFFHSFLVHCKLYKENSRLLVCTQIFRPHITRGPSDRRRHWKKPF